MGKINHFQKLKLFTGILYSNDDEFKLVLTQLRDTIGSEDYISDPIPFNSSDYYTNELGPSVKKIFISFKALIQPEICYKYKHISNNIEENFMEKGKRRVNIDPGVLSLHNIILLTTKNFCHRIPLNQGIYAETTLIYKEGGYQDLPWTYPDFKTHAYKSILLHIRTLYKKAYNVK
ncbi:DUF4416 family protein [Thermoproteota archaeon]